MDVMLQRHGARYIYVVPENLRELMSDISREVLRHQPDDLYTFIADFCDSLMITRENARVAARLVQYITEAAETIHDLMMRTGMNREEADRITTIIQQAFRKYMEKHTIVKTEGEIIEEILNELNLDEDTAHETACIIQRAFRKYNETKRLEATLLSGMIDWRVAAKSAINLYRKTGATYEEVHRAATLIKAAYKGYYTRRLLRRFGDELVGKTEFEEVEEEEELEKTVRIDFTTVKPRVLFDEKTELVEKLAEEESLIDLEAGDSETFIREHVVEEILKRVMKQITEKEAGTEAAEDQPAHELVDIFMSPHTMEEQEIMYESFDEIMEPATSISSPYTSRGRESLNEEEEFPESTIGLKTEDDLQIRSQKTETLETESTVQVAEEVQIDSSTPMADTISASKTEAEQPPSKTEAEQPPSNPPIEEEQQITSDPPIESP